MATPLENINSLVCILSTVTTFKSKIDLETSEILLKLTSFSVLLPSLFIIYNYNLL